MPRVNLTSREGVYVTTVNIPPMGVPPDSIQWNDRVFYHVHAESYSEGTHFVVPPMDVKVEKVPEAPKINPDDKV